MSGNIVLSVGFFLHSDDKRRITPNQKTELDELHKQKIDLAEEILVLNVGGYIRESTKNEIEYAKNNGKTIRFLEPERE